MIDPWQEPEDDDSCNCPNLDNEGCPYWTEGIDLDTLPCDECWEGIVRLMKDESMAMAMD